MSLMRVSGTFALFVLLLANGSALYQKSADTRSATVELAERSFLEVITEENMPILTGRIEEVRPISAADGDEHGQVLLDHVQEVSRARWKRDGNLALSYERYASESARIKSGSQGWNGVSLQPGGYLVLALGDRPPLEAVAVRSVEGPDDSYVKQLQWCLAAERETDPQARLALIKEAILSSQELLNGYGHYAAGRLKRIPRSDATALEISILRSRDNAEGTRIAAAQTLELELWESDNAADALNHRILQALWEALVDAPEDLQDYLGDALYRLIIDGAPSSEAKAKEYKKTLRRGITVDSDPKAAKALEEWGRRQHSQEEALQLVHWLRQ
jgi:hypothetical protein